MFHTDHRHAIIQYTNEHLLIPLLNSFVLQAGDDIVISTTGYSPMETETHQITAVSSDGRTLTLNQSLAHTHVGQFNHYVLCIVYELINLYT